jgi:MFS family permease
MSESRPAVTAGARELLQTGTDPWSMNKGAIRCRTGVARLTAGLTVGGIGWVIPFSAAATVLLPARLAVLDPADKVSLLALVSVAGSIVALVANVVFGALSDLTRSRFGRRNPWLIAGGGAAAVFMVLLATASDVWLILLWWCLYQAAQNAILSGLGAIVPDRVPSERRGTVSAVYGVGLSIGVAAGAAIGARFLIHPATGFMVLAAVVILLPVIAVLLAPDYSSRNSDRRTLTRSGLFRAFAFPRRAPDYYWALAGRLLIVFGYYLIYGYQLYILTDYMKLSRSAAPGFITLTALVSLIASVISAAVAGPVSDKIRRRKVMVIVASLLIATGAVIPYLAPHPWALLVFAAVSGLGLGAYLSVDAALISDVLPREESRAKDLGILNMANTGGQILAPSAAAAVVGAGLGYGLVFLVAITVSVLGALSVMPIRKVR